MRRNKLMLDEASRSVRRTFVGSIASIVGMFAVIGAAGAYGASERLNVKSLSTALTTLQIKLAPGSESIAPIPARTMTLASLPPGNAVITTVEPDTAIVREVAPVAAPAAPAIPDVPALVRLELPRAAEVTAADPARTSALPSPPVETQEKQETREISLPPEVSAPVVKPEAVALPTQYAQPHPKQFESNQDNALQDYPRMVMVHLPYPKPPLSPAQRLDLNGGNYEKAERCLAQAIYFEARNEPARGQMAVAQVVLNRVFSPYYPKDVCSVVYQNAHRHLSCQFTFACDGKPEAIRERGAWARAQRIARQTLHAQIWLPEVGKATHYHATYVRPVWIRDMKLLVQHGVHIFYRPRNWGDGSREHGWASERAAAAAAPILAAKKKGRNS